MKSMSILGWTSALLLSVAPLQAQETNEVEMLKKQLQQQQQQIDALIKQVSALTQVQSNAAPPPSNALTANSATSVEKSNDQKQLEAQLAAELGSTNAEPTAPTNASKPWSPTQPITIARAGSAYMNMSFDVLMDAGWSTASDPSERLELGDHDPQNRGFSLRNAEIALDGAVDPYFKGFANIALKLDKNNQSDIELEEAYLQSISLPANLQLKAGQFYAPFGRQNAQHPHAWAFVDAPIINDRLFGPDGMRNVGAQVSWLAPTPFYTEAFLGIFNGQGGTMYSFRNPGDADANNVNRFAGRATTDRHLSSADDFVLTPRITSSFELSESQTLTGGLSGAFGPNDTGSNNRTEIYGADLYWKWKPANASASFPFVSWQTEGMYRRFGAGADPSSTPALAAHNLGDWGAYSQVLWGFKPRWVAGLRGDYADGNFDKYDISNPFRGERWRVSPVLTFYPSEFSKVRLQYNYDRGSYVPVSHSVWLQVEFMLGSHAAHKY